MGNACVHVPPRGDSVTSLRTSSTASSNGSERRNSLPPILVPTDSDSEGTTIIRPRSFSASKTKWSPGGRSPGRHWAAPRKVSFEEDEAEPAPVAYPHRRSPPSAGTSPSPMRRQGPPSYRPSHRNVKNVSEGSDDEESEGNVFSERVASEVVEGRRFIPPPLTGGAASSSMPSLLRDLRKRVPSIAEREAHSSVVRDGVSPMPNLSRTRSSSENEFRRKLEMRKRSFILPADWRADFKKWGISERPLVNATISSPIEIYSYRRKGRRRAFTMSSLPRDGSRTVSTPTNPSLPMSSPSARRTLSPSFDK
eukprot:TRINITY_DN21318_c0_g4_i2.p1 TRINITY_DN21318_c0_g4~~TRINITY_DN21318_c0_g4_i2.p1  ORF type:complete len:345 (-),score=61.48 TRINITY_DN21318_c0_g4_i2:290-1216(-)